jgi:hypothetical protein
MNDINDINDINDMNNLNNVQYLFSCNKIYIRTLNNSIKEIVHVLYSLLLLILKT